MIRYPLSPYSITTRARAEKAIERLQADDDEFTYSLVIINEEKDYYAIKVSDHLGDLGML